MTNLMMTADMLYWIFVAMSAVWVLLMAACIVVLVRLIRELNG